MGLDDYEIVEALGRGAFGTVYLANQAILRRPVAIKLLDRIDYIDEYNRIRFERECIAMAALDHPNIVKVFEAGFSGPGVPYIVMEYLSGGSISQTSPLEMDRALTAITEAAEGLHAAHNAGIIHRDVKPDNLLLSTTGTVKLGDFGIALLDESLRGSLSLTSGPAGGTYYYMAPELFMGGTNTISTDVYALGATLFTLLIGSPPYFAPTDQGPGPLMRRILDDPLPPPPTPMPRAVAELLDHALAKQPDARPASAAEFAERAKSIRRVLAGKISRGAAFERLKARADVGDTDAILALGARSEASRPHEAELWYRSAADLGDTRAMVRLGIHLSRHKQRDEAERWYRRAAELGDTRAMVYLGSHLSRDRRQDEAERWYEAAARLDNTSGKIKLADTLSRRRPEDAEHWYRSAANDGDLDAVISLGDLLTRAERDDEAEYWYRMAAERGRIPSMTKLGHVLGRQGRIDEAEGWYRKAAEVAKVLIERSPPNLAGVPPTLLMRKCCSAMVSLGDLLSSQGRADEAERWYRDAIRHGDRKAPLLLGDLLRHVGRIDEAEDCYQLLAERGNTAAMIGLGDLLSEVGRTEEARGWYQAAVDKGSTEAADALRRLPPPE